MSLHSVHPLERKTPLSWQDRLDDAASEAEIVAIAKDFVAQFSPEEIHLLPAVCRPGKFMEANDVTSYAFTLVRHDCEESAESTALVHRLASFFSNASIRLSQVLAHSAPAEDDSRISA